MSNVFRSQYRELTADEQVSCDDIKAIAQSLWDEIEIAASFEKSDKRMLALAKTNLEQAVMWAVKGITG